MTEASDTLKQWIAAGEPFMLIAAGMLVAACFVIFNAVRVFLYIPQIVTCWSDRHGCRTINLYTWCSWLVANASTGLYMWLFQSDLVGLCLNLGNALMCSITVAITLAKRRQRSRHGPAASRHLPYREGSSLGRGTPVTSGPALEHACEIASGCQQR